MEQNCIDSVERHLKALLLLLIEARPMWSDKLANVDASKIEVILDKAGYKTAEIALILDKNTSAVQKTLQRSKKNGKK